MKALAILLLTLSAPALQAQSLERQVIAPGGGFAVNGASISYTLGQEATLSALPGIRLTQGFQQVDPSEMLGVLDVRPYSGVALAYPNPTQDVLHIRSELSTLGIAHLECQILDLHGKRVAEYSISSDAGTIDVSSLRASSYTLVLLNEAQQFRQHIRFVKL